MKKQILTTACALFLTVGVANAQIVVRIGPPPPRPVEVVPAPRAGFVWVPGYHRWDGHRYIWVAGAYRHPPRGRHIWVAGEWRAERGGHVWHAGHWR